MLELNPLASDFNISQIENNRDRETNLPMVSRTISMFKFPLFSVSFMRTKRSPEYSHSAYMYIYICACLYLYQSTFVHCVAEDNQP